MITRQEYLNALEIIDKYHRQNILIENESKKTEIRDWLNSLDKAPSTTLFNILLNTNGYGDGNPPFKYVEDVTQREFLRLRQAGKQSWLEFYELRKQQISK